MPSSTPIDYEPIKPPKKGRVYHYKCRRCGAPATWKETFESRDRRRCRAVWCICDKCYQAAKDGRHDGSTSTGG